jgi:hypothetical protein
MLVRSFYRRLSLRKCFVLSLIVWNPRAITYGAAGGWKAVATNVFSAIWNPDVFRRRDVVISCSLRHCDRFREVVLPGGYQVSWGNFSPLPPEREYKHTNKKAVPLHAMVVLEWREDIAPIHS